MSVIGKTFKVALDMKQPTAQRNEWEVVEGDNGNVIEITLTDDGSPVDLSNCKVLAVFGLPTGQTVEQDTEDAYVILADYGVAVTGTPDENDTVTITVTGGACSASISGTGISAATVDGDVFRATFPEDGTYVFKYVTAWQYGDNSVTIGGTDHNVITIALKTGSFSPGKAASGLMKCEIQVYSGVPQNTLVTSAQFTFRCRRAIMNDETIAATDDYPVLVELIHEVQQLQIANQSDWDEADPTDPAYIRNKPTSMTPTAHHATHEAGGTDEITLPTASTSGAGIVQLYDGVDSTSDTTAATANSAKVAYDYANDAYLLAGAAIPSSEKGASSGVATLDSNGKVVATQASRAAHWISASLTLSENHAGCMLHCSSSSAITVTIPKDANYNFPIGTEIMVCRWNTGTLTIAGQSGVQIRSLGSKFTISGQNGVAWLKKQNTDTWLLWGDLG